MTYPQVVDWLFSQLANYQKQGASAYKPGLGNITALLNGLNNPQQHFKSIHIAGTNGKGSTAHILTAMAIENGYKVGLFTSPHIKDFRERIKVNGQMVSEEFVVRFVTANKPLLEALQPSFFEITTAMAFMAFAEQNCDWAIIETGLGGRLDSTNVLSPKIAVITNIGLDHTEFLGDTLAAIATEKAGIIKPNTPVIIGEILPETKESFYQIAAKAKAPIYQPKLGSFKLDLLGDYQQKNAALAWESIQVLKQNGHFFDDQKSRPALTRIRLLTNFTGRLTQIQDAPKVIVDASHNPAGIQTLFEEIKQLKYNKLHCVYGSATDKNYALSMTYFPQTAKYYFTTFDSKRAASTAELSDLGFKNNLEHTVFNQPEDALAAAKANASSSDLIIVFGSFYILEKII